MIALMIGFVTLALGIVLTTQVVSFAERLYTALNDSSVQAIKDLADFSTLIVLIWLAAVIASGVGLIWVGFRGIAKAG